MVAELNSNKKALAIVDSGATFRKVTEGVEVPMRIAVKFLSKAKDVAVVAASPASAVTTIIRKAEAARETARSSRRVHRRKRGPAIFPLRKPSTLVYVAGRFSDRFACSSFSGGARS